MTGTVPTTAAVTPLRAEGDRPPMFCPPPVSGSLYWCLPLTRLLHPEQAIYALEAPGLDGTRQPLQTFDALVDAYVQALRATRPRGPYVLVGYSMGGAIAYEMAVRLTAAGETVRRTILIDSELPDGEPGTERNVVRRFVADVAGSSGRSPAGLPIDQVFEAPDADARLRGLLCEADLLPSSVDAELVARRYRIFRANTRAYLAYRPSRYAGAITVIRAADSPPEKAAEWRTPCAGRVTELTVPGDHHSIWFPENVPHLARCLDAALAPTAP